MVIGMNWEDNVSGTASLRANRTPLLSIVFDPAEAVISNVSVLLY
jgi:hypothetical protein